MVVSGLLFDRAASLALSVRKTTLSYKSTNAGGWISVRIQQLYRVYPCGGGAGLSLRIYMPFTNGQ